MKVYAKLEVHAFEREGLSNLDLMRSKEKASRHLDQNEQKRLRAEERCAKENQLCQKLDSDLALLQQRLNDKKAEVEGARL